MKMVRKVVITSFGEAENMKVVLEPLQAPEAGEVQLRQTAIGFNFIDIYQRKGVYLCRCQPASDTKPPA